jgi:superoxide dismutase
LALAWKSAAHLSIDPKRFSIARRAEQLAPHYSAHYGGALRGYLAADKKLQASISTGTIIDSTGYGAIQRARANKANSVLLHELYFGGMALKKNNDDVKTEVRLAIEKRFGSIDKWAADFQASAKAASGWAVNELKELLGDAVTLVIETIEKHINCFFVQALQLDPETAESAFAVATVLLVQAEQLFKLQSLILLTKVSGSSCRACTKKQFMCFSMVSITKVTASPSSSFNSFNAPLMIAS